MRLGVFAKTYVRNSVDETFASAARDGFECVQFNLACAGLASLPEEQVPDRITREILGAARSHGVEIAAVSGTFNMAHPLKSARLDGLRRLGIIIQWAAAAGVPVVTLCTGTRDPVDMWRHHPENTLPQAWNDFAETLMEGLAAAELAGVLLAVEPEPGNVVRDAQTARRLLKDFAGKRLGVILDPANLLHIDFPHGDSDSGRLEEAVELLAPRTVLVHAKDRRADGTVCPPGYGLVRFLPFLTHLRREGYSGPVVIHGIGETELPGAVRYMRSVLDAVATGSTSPDVSTKSA